MGPRPAASTPTCHRGFLILSLAGLAATFACYLLFVRIPAGRRVDDDAYGGALGHGVHLDFLNGLLSRMTSGWLLVVMALLVGVGILRRRLLLGVAAALAAGLPVVADSLLRYHVFTDAPLAVSEPLGNTFPSGHAITAIGVGMALILLAPARFRGYVTLAVLVFASAIGDQLQVIGWHRPADVTGSAFLAFAVVCAIGGTLRSLRPGLLLIPHDDRPYERILIGASCVGTGVTLVDAILYAASRGDMRNEAPLTEAYVAGLGLTVASLAVVLLALLRLLNCANQAAPTQ